MMIKKVMIATDGSDAGRKAAAAAVEIARRSGASIIAVYVMDIYRLAHLPGYATLPGLKDKILELMEDEGREATDYVQAIAERASVPCKKILSQGSPAAEILRVSLEEEADMLVMGSHGRTALEKVLLGGVAEKVVLQSALPVLLIKGEQGH
ncbi:MAG TPA: universal stress protein [Methanothrix sp.]|nr:universal stress protein [Methanothrix sp.]HRS85896.1 universal stress protein [Methanothrix sp.]